MEVKSTTKIVYIPRAWTSNRDAKRIIDAHIQSDPESMWREGFVSSLHKLVSIPAEQIMWTAFVQFLAIQRTMWQVMNFYLREAYKREEMRLAYKLPKIYLSRYMEFLQSLQEKKNKVLLEELSERFRSSASTIAAAVNQLRSYAHFFERMCPIDRRDASALVPSGDLREIFYDQDLHHFLDPRETDSVTAVVLVDTRLLVYLGHVYVFTEEGSWNNKYASECQMIGIRSSMFNLLAAACNLQVRHIAKRLLEGVRNWCTKQCDICPIYVSAPHGIMPLVLYREGFQIADSAFEKRPRISEEQLLRTPKRWSWVSKY
jgi:hypothetical protein